MGLSCGASILKYTLFLFNILFFICGAGILGISIWLLVDDNIRDYLDIAINANGNDFIDIALYCLIGVGAFTFLVGFLGFCGACKESSCMLCTYAVLVGIIFTVQIAGAITAAVFKDEIKDGLQDSMSDQANKFVTEDTTDATTRIWYRMQYQWDCCGGRDYTDYRLSEFFNKTTRAVPETCCKLANSDPLNPQPVDYDTCQEEANDNEENPQQLYRRGCYTSLNDFIDDHMVIIIGVGFGLAAFQIVCIIFAVCVRNKVNEQYEYA